MDESIRELRRNYRLAGLTEADAGNDPLHLFEQWFDAATKSPAIEPNAMMLATVDEGGRPAARMVLLKGFDERGFAFYTNYESRKGRELAARPQAALCFWWAELERQVRIEGAVERVSAEESDTYFASRPKLSQFGAILSPQSEVIASREALEVRAPALLRKLGDGPIPRPDHWGGFRVVPNAIEFWQGRESRLHDRLLFTRDGTGWKRVRLAP